MCVSARGQEKEREGQRGSTAWQDRGQVACVCKQGVRRKRGSDSEGAPHGRTRDMGPHAWAREEGRVQGDRTCHGAKSATGREWISHRGFRTKEADGTRTLCLGGGSRTDGAVGLYLGASQPPILRGAAGAGHTGAHKGPHTQSTSSWGPFC